MLKKKEEKIQIDRETWERLRSFRNTKYKEKYEELERYLES